MAMLWDLFVGAYAPVLSGVCGLVGSACLAIPPIRSWGLRNAALTFQKLTGSRLFDRAAQRGQRVATGKLRQELKLERIFNFAGAASLFAAFLLLILHALWGQGT